jgi:hypothetical protein
MNCFVDAKPTLATNERRKRLAFKVIGPRVWPIDRLGITSNGGLR